MAPSTVYEWDATSVARRIRALRHYKEGGDHGSRTRFANRVKIDRANWSHYERTGEVPRAIIFQLCRFFGGDITSDWIYFGVTSGMPSKVAEELAQHERAVCVGTDEFMFTVAHELAHTKLTTQVVDVKVVDNKGRHYPRSSPKKPVTKSRA